MLVRKPKPAPVCILKECLFRSSSVKVGYRSLCLSIRSVCESVFYFSWVTLNLQIWWPYRSIRDLSTAINSAVARVRDEIGVIQYHTVIRNLIQYIISVDVNNLHLFHFQSCWPYIYRTQIKSHK